MPKKGRGERESVWHVIRRCQAILHRVQQGPAKKPALLKAVYARVGEDAYGYSEGEALAKKFDRDKRRLRKHLGVNVRYDASAGGYVIAGHEAALLNLSDTHLETLAFLADTFEPDSPHGRQVQELVDTLTGWLPDDRRRAYRRMRGLLPDVELPLRDSEPITPEVWEKVLTAHNDRQQLKFDYLSSSHSDDVPRQHVVEPWHLYFSQRGHYRLDAYCLFNDGPHGPWEPHRFFNYRLSRIVPGSVEILPRRMPPSRTQRPYEVVYELSPQIARFGVSPRPELIAPPKIEEGEEGWVSVKGQTYDVFHLARNLLYYGAHCRVLGGPELRGEVEKLVQGLREMYE